MATPTALDAQKRQFNGLYAAFVEKLHVNHRYIPTKEKYDKMLTAFTSATVNSKIRITTDTSRNMYVLKLVKGTLFSQRSICLMKLKSMF